MNLILKNARIISQNLDEISDIKIENGIIVEISKGIQGEGIDFSGKIITPGFIEMHCHLREPGFEYKETIETGSIAAQNGGYVAICPMANTNPVNDNIETLKYIMNKAAQVGKVKILPVCAVTKGLNGEELTDIKALKQAGAIAFSDDGKPINNSEILEQALKTGELIISHPEEVNGEAECVKRELEIYKKVGGRLHFAHISTKESIDLIRKAKKEGLKVTCETAPHYFTFTNEDVTKDGQFKMNPQLATKEDLNAVIEGLKDGTIDCIATDHAPHSLEEKQKPFNDAPFGIIGFETALGASLKLVEKGYLTINKLIEKLSTNPTKILGLDDFGTIKIGQKANLTIIMPDCKYVVNKNEFKSKCKNSPFEGMELKGISIATVLDGKIIFNEE